MHVSILTVISGPNSFGVGNWDSSSDFRRHGFYDGFGVHQTKAFLLSKAFYLIIFTMNTAMRKSEDTM